MTTTARRVRVRVDGTVQGVGFRPHVFRLACELGLAGFVRNDTRGVVIEAEGPGEAIDELLERIERDAPALACVERLEVDEAPPTGASGFEIADSERAGVVAAAISPDTATCEECLAELRDPADRRFRYPFINCTNCGPRFTIVRGIPYDRPLTTMAAFTMCASCRAEYDDPADRRFHAQPNACARCGPALTLRHPDGRHVALGVAGDPIAAAARALTDGAIVAVKGIGGYHLACRADDERAVHGLRARKHREDRPFAVMAADLAQAGALMAVGALERDLLCSPARPIVLAPRRPGAAVADSVAPGAAELGVMLPYSPLHHLLLGDCGTPIVLTSGNLSDEPIAFRDADALERLAAIADLFLAHDRPIETRTDDSVVRAVDAGATGRRPALVRRSRGYVPGSLPLAGSPRPLLACGAEQKSTFAVAKSGRAWISHHIGDLSSYEALRAFTDGVEHLCRLFEVEPEVVVHDMHPDYLSTAHALEREGVELVAVQHHHAHLAACLAEHGEEGPAVGAIFDGTGYGTDGTIWGGELLVGGTRGFERAGSLWPVRMPGGAAAIREPWRMACAWLGEAFGERRPLPARLRDVSGEERWRLVAALAENPALSPTTTSAGRLFDAVAALCGIRGRVTYEGQAAVELEAAGAAAGRSGTYEVELVESPAGAVVIDPRSALREIAADLDHGDEPGPVAARFHAGIARATASACLSIASRRSLDTAVLSGGAFQNRLLLEEVGRILAVAGMRVLTPVRLPANDGGISYGQAAVAAAR